jgi:alkylation response protein AidB-like acyl-CoA dehydrogenase
MMATPVMYDGDQQDLAALCRRIFTAHLQEIVRNLEDPSTPTHVPALWTDLVRSGFVGMALPADVGGGNASWTYLAIVLREAGRALVPTTLSSTVFAATVIDRLGDDTQRRKLLEPLLSTGGIATVAASSTWADPSVFGLSATLTRAGDGWVLAGHDGFVANAELAELHVVAARDEQGTAAFVVVPAQADGVRCSPRTTFGGDSQSSVVYDRVVLPVEARLAGSDEALPRFLECLDAMNVLHAGEMLGGGEHVVEATAEYVTLREQFGVAIGSFQAVQHLLADAASDLAAGEAAWWRAAGLLPDGPGARIEAAASNAWLARSFVDATVTAHQVHGGIGYARENPLYLWSQRARQLELTGGTPRDQLEIVASVLYGDDRAR